MGRRAYTESIRLLPRIWVLRLLCLFQAELWQLNAQLTLPPESSEEFQFGVSPYPIDKRLVPNVFQQAFDRGRDPSERLYLEPKLDGQRYNLFLRVARHVPFSEDWLFQPFVPYLGDTLPDVAYSANLVNRLLKRLGLRRMGATATAFAIDQIPRLVRRREERSLLAMAERPDPLHLMLLFSLYHERKWHYPNSAETRSLDGICCSACRSFAARDEFTWSEQALAYRSQIERELWKVVLKIRHIGHHSAPPQYPAKGLFDPGPRGEAQLGILDARHCVICDPNGSFDEADLCAGLGYEIPISYFIYGKPTAYSADAIPSTSESRHALSQLMRDADIPPRRLFKYGRDESVLLALSEVSAA